MSQSLTDLKITCKGIRCNDCQFRDTEECGPMGFIPNERFDGKLTLGHWGGADETYAYNKGIYQVVVDCETSGVLKRGEKYRIGIYTQGSVEALDIEDRDNFDLDRLEKECEEFIERTIDGLINHMARSLSKVFT